MQVESYLRWLIEALYRPSLFVPYVTLLRFVFCFFGEKKANDPHGAKEKRRMDARVRFGWISFVCSKPAAAAIMIMTVTMSISIVTPSWRRF